MPIDRCLLPAWRHGVEVFHNNEGREAHVARTLRGKSRLAMLAFLQPPGIFRTVAAWPPPSLVAHKEGMGGRRTAARTGGPNRRRWMLPAKTMMRVLLFTYRRSKSETMYLEEGKDGGRGVKIDENEMR